MFVCLFVCVYWTSKTAEPIAPKSHMTPGKENGCSELQKIVSIFFDFCKILKIHEKNNNSAKIDIIVLLKRNCWKVGQQLKVEIVDGREASWYTNIYIYTWWTVCTVDPLSTITLQSQFIFYKIDPLMGEVRKNFFF